MSQLFTVFPSLLMWSRWAGRKWTISLSDSSPMLVVFITCHSHIFINLFSKKLLIGKTMIGNRVHFNWMAVQCILYMFNIVPSFFFCLFFCQSKRKFERECKEAEKSQITYDRLDNDINATKSEVEKVWSYTWSTPVVNHLFICKPEW